jgi:hypothetical protein
VPKDPRIVPPFVDVAPYRLPRAIMAEQAALARQLKEVLAGSPGVIDLRRMEAIEAERALIEHHERQEAHHHQAAQEARARLASLMRPAYNVNVAAAAPVDPNDPQLDDRLPVVSSPVDPVEPVQPGDQAATTPKPDDPDPKPNELVADAIVRVAKDLYPKGTGTVGRKEVVAAINDALATDARGSGRPPPRLISRDRAGRALGWRKG